MDFLPQELTLSNRDIARLALDVATELFAIKIGASQKSDALKEFTDIVSKEVMVRPDFKYSLLSDSGKVEAFVSAYHETVDNGSHEGNNEETIPHIKAFLSSDDILVSNKIQKTIDFFDKINYNFEHADMQERYAYAGRRYA